MRTWMLPALGAWLLTASAWAQSPQFEEPARRLSPEELDRWLSDTDRDAVSDSDADDREAPPPPPRRQGINIESSIGALGHLGALRNISPVSPWFHLKIGVEPFRWLLVFVETDLVFSTTAYASPPPNPRTYRLYGAGGGLRATMKVAERLGVYAEGSLGGARVSEDVLSVYGYREATGLHPYFGGRLGLEWYPHNPHLALGVHGGLRSFNRGLDRDRSTDAAYCWLSGAALRYTF